MQASCLSLDCSQLARTITCYFCEAVPSACRPCYTLQPSTSCPALPCSVVQTTASKQNQQPHSNHSQKLGPGAICFLSPLDLPSTVLWRCRHCPA